MNRLILRGCAVCITLISVFSPGTGIADDAPRMDEVVVTAPLSGRFLQSTDAETTVITAAEMERMQVRTIPELLRSLSSVHLTERGTPGSLTDLSMRGSSAEGALLLINGVRVADPQTGHFLLDIPVGLDGVERVEVLSGGGSPLYGSSAAGGIVNIVTREGGGSGGSFSTGSFGGRRVAGSFAARNDRAGVTVHAEWRRSDGYMDGTDLESALFSGSGRWSTDAWTVRWNGGILQKSFGAKGFYGPWPSFEKVAGIQGGIHAVRMVDEHSQLRLRLGARGHRDDYTLDRNRPEYYRNTHYNRGYLLGGEYLRSRSGGGSFTLGAEAERIGITSGKLGNHRDYTGALYSEYRRMLGKAECSLSLRFDRGFRRENVLSPVAGITVPFLGVYRFRARIDRSFRSPTYTERYYDDPANRGNPALRSERSLLTEAGIERGMDNATLGVTFFRVQTSQSIDWVRNPGDAVWSADNHGRVLTSGVEGAVTAPLAHQWNLRGGCTLLRQDVRDRRGLESKYALNPAMRSIAASLYGPLPGGLACSLSTRHERMREGDIRTPVDVRFSRRFGAVRAGVAGYNIGNERYEEIPGLRASGRWFNLELEFNS